ncbi:MAG: hypothetical protein OHK93_001329 [Ramalina farinacea]|uniref:Uncharacterized protein n=1 Tax=Ramalina farinacea TaxID=258253 RepID=A0AA43QRC0_9LECA|nr:hypothetical protein [Ramalina farinacea]
MKLGTLRLPDFLIAKDKKQIAPIYGLLATAPWDTSLVERDVLEIRQWFEQEQRQISKRGEAVLEQSQKLDEQAAQYHDEAAWLTMRAKARSPDGKGSLTQEEKIGLQQHKKTLDEYRKVLQRRRLEIDQASAVLPKSLKEKITGLQKLVHDKTVELTKELMQQGVPKEKIEEKISVSRDAVREMTAALVKEFFPEEGQQVRMFDSLLKQPS